MRDSYTNRMQSPSHEMWSYETRFYLIISVHIFETKGSLDDGHWMAK